MNDCKDYGLFAASLRQPDYLNEAVAAAARDKFCRHPLAGSELSVIKGQERSVNPPCFHLQVLPFRAASLTRLD
ncbi:hypothetical protein E2C01_067325 [Portunus trituberculatus]|uniref:Uncharacterized protein n=1 Tax=Portunus trituberculatus TaxID=210409 RepID=A0A5B7HTB3_PORTR|nr:hypothetical protein [Portunus trituberculatus]